MLTYGIEIEFHSEASEGAIVQAFADAGLSLARPHDPQHERHNGNAVRAWTLKYDAGGYEVVSPLLEGMSCLESEAAKLQNALRSDSVDADTPNGCGFHLHVSPSGTGFRVSDAAGLYNIGLRWRNYEPVFNTMIEDYRRGRYQWAANNTPLRVSDYTAGTANLGRYSTLGDIGYELARKFQSGDRYRKVNYTSLARHGTIEFRGMHATTEASVIVGFARFFTDLVESSMAMQRVRKTPTDQDVLARFARLSRFASPETMVFVRSRIHQFGNMRMRAEVSNVAA